MKERKKIKIRIVPRKGIHSFDQKLPIYPCEPSTYKIKEEIADEDKAHYQFALVNNINDKDKYRIFFLSEYLKRQFFLDLTGEKYESLFLKEKNGKYKIIDYGSNQAKEIVLRNIGITSNEKIQFEKSLNDSVTANIFSKSDNYYSFIKNFYDDRYRKFCEIISEIREKAKSNQCYENSVINYLINMEITPYIFERIIYSLNYFSTNQDVFRNLFGHVRDFLYKNEYLFIFMTFSYLHKFMVNRYKLYLHDLLNMSDISQYINIDQPEVILPRFFFIPLESYEDVQIEDMVDFRFNPGDVQSSIVINIDDNFNIVRLANYIKDNIILGLYQIKESLNLGYTEEEVKILSSLIDSDNKHNTKEDFEKRLKYLYLWDRFYLSNEESSISSAILHYLNKYSPDTRKTKALTDMLTRGIKNTSTCIEQGKYLPLA